MASRHAAPYKRHSDPFGGPLGRDYIDVTDIVGLSLQRGGIIQTVITGMVFDGESSDPIPSSIRDALVAL